MSDFFTAQKQGTYFAQKYIRAEDNEGNTALHLAVQNEAYSVSHVLFTDIVISLA